MRKLVTLILILSCYVATNARAADVPALNTVSGSVAGHPVQVNCVTDWTVWETELTFRFPTHGNPRLYEGFTNTGVPTVFINPDLCETLTLTLNLGYRNVGTMMFAEAITVLLHESLHQRGMIDEGETDCAAVALTEQTAVSSFGVPATVTKRIVSYHRVNGKRVRYVKTIKVRNPELDQLNTWVLYWHHLRPSAYQGVC